MTSVFDSKKRNPILMTLILLGTLCLAGDAPRKSTDTGFLEIMSGGVAESRPAKAVQSRSSDITLTVAVASGGLTVRLYDEFGSLVERTPLLTPPTTAVLNTPDGSAIELRVPGGTFSGSAIVDIYMKGRTEVRPLIAEADSRSLQESAIPFGNTGPLEFTATSEPLGVVSISLSYPEGSNPALLNSLEAYYLGGDDVNWVPVRSSRLNPEKRTVTFDVSRFQVFRLMTGAAHDLNGVIAYPNPFRPRSAKDNVLKFIGLTDDVVVKIFTISGDLVWSSHIRYAGGGATWNGRNLEGKEVSSGLYVYQITNAKGEKFTERLSVLW